MLCLMLESYPLMSHDHINRKMKIWGNLVMIFAMKGISNFGHTIFKLVWPSSSMFTSVNEATNVNLSSFYKSIYNGNICHMKVCETSDFSLGHWCPRPIMEWIWWGIYTTTINTTYSVC
jgi:hypothetical protein